MLVLLDKTYIHQLVALVLVLFVKNTFIENLLLRSLSNLLLCLEFSLFKFIYLPLLLLDLETDFLDIRNLLLYEVAKPETFVKLLAW